MNSLLSGPNQRHIGEAIIAGNKVEAIQRYRKIHHTGLAESKKAVEEMEARMRLATPEAFAATDAIKAKSQKRFIVFYYLIAIITAIIGVDNIMRMTRGEMTSLFTVSLPWISMLCFIGAARSIRKSMRVPPTRK